MTTSTLSRSALLVTILHLASGCSWAFMTKPPEPVLTPNYPVECTSSRAAPVLDTICSGYFVVNAVVLAGMKSCDEAAFGESCVESGTKTGGMILSAGLATLCAISAGSGYGMATKCGEVKTQNAMCITGDEAACKKLNSTWTPPMKLPAGAAAAPGEPATGCSKDTDCKGNRVCDRGTCVEPAAKAGP
jgi:hypothetical protein